jgi:hypothetical protein
MSRTYDIVSKNLKSLERVLAILDEIRYSGRTWFSGKEIFPAIRVILDNYDNLIISIGLEVHDQNNAIVMGPFTHVRGPNLSDYMLQLLRILDLLESPGITVYPWQF